MKIISMCVAVIAVFFIFSAPAAAQDPGQNCGMKKRAKSVQNSRI